MSMGCIFGFTCQLFATGLQTIKFLLLAEMRTVECQCSTFQDGSVYIIFPGLPLAQVADGTSEIHVAFMFVTSIIARGLGMRTVTPIFFYTVSFLLVYLAFYCMHNLFLAVIF
jgi:hypothetical protein